MTTLPPRPCQSVSSDLRTSCLRSRRTMRSLITFRLGVCLCSTVMSSSNQEKYAQSPLQSLTAAFNRQTTQRSRNTDSSSQE